MYSSQIASQIVAAFAITAATSFGWTANAASVDLLALSKKILGSVRAPGEITSENCASTVSALVSEVNAVSSDQLKRTEIVRTSKPVIENFWQARLLLREKMIRFAQAGDLSPTCVKSLRNAFRSFRFFEEYVAVHRLPQKAWMKPEATRVFSGGFPATMMTAQFPKLKIQSGDVLVSYGMAYGSAAIAHVGEDSGTFSHMAIVYQDKAGELFTIEAHPEFGVKVAPLEKYLTDGKGRSALFRHKNTELAKLAAKRIYDLAWKADSSGSPIPYDFTMNAEDASTLFCTEVIQYAFGLAAREMGISVTIPAFPTRISMKNSYILDSFGISSRITFAPSDIEVDPQFTLLAEWRDVARVRLMHLQQAALQSQFTWLDSLAYQYRSNLTTILASRTLYTTRHLPLFDGFVDDLVPPDLSEKTLEAVVQVYLVSEELHNSLIIEDEYRDVVRGVLMTSKEILAAAEKIRKTDLSHYLRYRKWQNEGRLKSEPAPPMNQWHWMLRSETETVNGPSTL